MPLAFANIYANLAEAIRADHAGRAPDPLALTLPSAEDGLHSLRVVHAAVRSARARGGGGGGGGRRVTAPLSRRTAVWPARARRGATYENETPATAGHSSMGGGTGPGPPPVTDWSRSRNAPVIIPDSSDAR